MRSGRRRNGSSTKDFSVFEFDEEEGLIERSAKKILGKFRRLNKAKHVSDDSPLIKYDFLRCFSRATQKGLHIDAGEGADTKRIYKLDDTAPSANSHVNNYLDYGSLSSGANADADESVGISDDEDIIKLTSTSGPLEDQKVEDDFSGNHIGAKVVISADYLMYGNCKTCQLTFYCSHIKLDGPTAFGSKESISFEWAITDVIKIESRWYEQFETAILKLYLKSKDANIGEEGNESSGVVELKFAVHDSLWSGREEAIKSLDIRYKAAWNIGFDCAESFKDISYPKGDPDAVSIGIGDIEQLRPETFINDTIIDFYIQYLKNKINPEQKRRFHFFNSFFFRKLADLDNEPSRAHESRAAFRRVCKWTRRVDLFEKDYIFIPVNFRLHWSLIVICHPGEVFNIEDNEMDNAAKVPCILHMDSIKGSHRGLKNLFQSYLWEEWKERHCEAGPEVCSKFLTLQFVPLQLPQQENASDCGLFLLHYVELFLNQAPTNFNPYKISKFSNFLNKDWFPPADASLKRAHIKKLIYQIIEDYSQKFTSAPCNYNNSSALLDAKGKTDVEFLQEVCNYTGTISDSDSHHTADHEIEITPSIVTPSKYEIWSGDLLERGDNVMLLAYGNLKNVLTPIEEVEETEQIGSSPKDISGPSRTSYSSGDIRTMETNWLRKRVINSVEYEKAGRCHRTPAHLSPISSDVQVHENDLHEEFKGSNSDEEIKCKYSSMSADGIAACIVADSEEEMDDICEVGESESDDGIAACVVEDSEEEMEKACKVGDSEGSSDQEGVLILSSPETISVSTSVSASRLEKQQARKRRRPVPVAGIDD